MNRPSTAKSSLSERLQHEQSQLELMFDSLSAFAARGDWRVCSAIWGAFSEELEAHMRYEEEVLLPTYSASSPYATHLACQLLTEQEDICDELARVGKELRQHCLPTLGIQDLIERLREHGRQKSATVYRYWQQRERGATIGPVPAVGFAAIHERCNVA